MGIIILVCLILLSGLLSLAEIAFVSAKKSRLEIEIKKGKKSARTALDLANNPDRFLSTAQLGITLISILSGLLSGELFVQDFANVLSRIPWLETSAYIVSKTLIVFVITYLSLVIGELVPKRLGMGFAEKIAMLMASSVNFLALIAFPFVWLLSKSTGLVMSLMGLGHIEESKVTEEEIKAIVKEGFDGGEVQEVEQDIVERVFTLGDRDVGSIMTHRSDLVWIDINDTPEKIRAKVRDNLYNTYPVVSDKLDNIEGVIYLKDLFDKIDMPGFSLSQSLRPAQFVPEDQSVYKALEQFKKARVKYGIVTDEFGGIQGIVTLNDILEALIGQVLEPDEELDITERDDGSWLVDGQYSFYDFLAYFDMEDLYAENDFNTLSGLILDELERVPKTGDKLVWKKFVFEIVDMDKARIDKVLVKKVT
ncbi:MAG: hemolysin family protein [Clostridiales bacterium]|jgi:putative hemolysin|nr:hemolysin family protein [Clostridiales bacterium]